MRNTQQTGTQIADPDPGSDDDHAADRHIRGKRR
jgi:hypothetical protein